MPEPEFPLKESTVQAALDELSLPWVIFEEETRTVSENDPKPTLFSLRDPEKKQSAYSENTLFYGGILSGTIQGKRELDVTLESEAHGLTGKPFAWEDWKQEIILATVLYGGAEDREEAYRALSKLDVPQNDGFELGVSLSNGYCVVKRKMVQPGQGRYILWVHFYESEEHYQEKQKARENVFGESAAK